MNDRIAAPLLVEFGDSAKSLPREATEINLLRATSRPGIMVLPSCSMPTSLSSLAGDADAASLSPLVAAI